MMLPGGSRLRYSFITYSTLVGIIVVLLVVSLSNVSKNRINNVLTAHYQSQTTTDATQVGLNVRTEINNAMAQVAILAKIDAVRSLDPKVCQPEIDQLYKEYGAGNGNIGRIGPDGVFYCSANRQLIGVKGASLGSYITQIFNDPNHAAVISRAIKPAGSSTYLLAVHVPVYDDNGKFVGTLGAGIPVNHLGEDIFIKTKPSPHGYFTMLDDDGTILEHPVTAYIGQNFFGDSIQKFTGHNQVLNAAVRNAEAGHITSTHFKANGAEERFIVYVPVHINPTRRVIIGAIVPIQDIATLNSQLRANSSLVGVGISMTVLLFIITWALFMYLNYRVFRPVEQMAQAAVAIRDGDTRRHVPVSGGYEIATLGTVLNTMVDRLRSYSSQLESEVNSKTAQLDQHTKQVEQQNKQLEDSRRAILNVLEDLNHEKTQLIASKTKDNAILSGIGDGLIIFNENGVVERMNRAAQNMLGYSEAEAIRRRGVTFLKAEDDSGKTILAADRPLHLALTKGETVQRQLNYVTKDGRRLAVDLNVTPLTLNEEIIGAIEVFRDITEERALDKAKDDFLSLVSHQLQTPATAVKQFLGLLLQGYFGKVKKEHQELIQKAYDNNEDQITIIQDLLEVARIEAGKSAINLTEINLSQLAQQLADAYDGAVKKQEHTLTIDIPANLMVTADETKLKMCLSNLLSNAIKYTPPKGKITLSASETADTVNISVADNGMGIPAEQQTKLFQRFSRVHEVQKSAIEGTGIGLFLCKQIAEMHGGKITVQSEVGHGTTFTVELKKDTPK